MTSAQQRLLLTWFRDRVATRGVSVFSFELTPEESALWHQAVAEAETRPPFDFAAHRVHVYDEVPMNSNPLPATIVYVREAYVLCPTPWCDGRVRYGAEAEPVLVGTVITCPDCQTSLVVADEALAA